MINPTPQGARKRRASQGKNSKKGGFRQLLLVLEAEDKGFEHPSESSENRVVFKKRVINPTQEHAEAVAELLDIIADSKGQLAVELLRMARELGKLPVASGGR